MPSRKVISIFIIASSLVFLVIFTSTPSQKTQNSDLTGVSSVNKVEVATTENSDWEKEVQNLSLKNTGVNSKDSKKTEETDNVTEEFSESFLANYLSMKQSGTFDGTAALNLVDKSAKFIQGNSTSSNLTIRDIIVSPNNSKEAIQKYGNDLGLILKANNSEDEPSNELEIIKALIEGGDTSKAKDLESIASAYQAVALSFTKIIVPSSFSNRHLELTRATNNLSFSLQDIAKYGEDPLKALSGLSVYTTNFDIAVKTLNSIRMDLLKAGAIYKQGDNGYFLYFSI